MSRDICFTIMGGLMIVAFLSTTSLADEREDYCSDLVHRCLDDCIGLSDEQSLACGTKCQDLEDKCDAGGIPIPPPDAKQPPSGGQ